MKTKEDHLENAIQYCKGDLKNYDHLISIEEATKAMETYANQKVAEERDDEIREWLLLNRYPEHIGEEDSYTALDYNDLAQFLSQPEAEKVQEDGWISVNKALQDKANELLSFDVNNDFEKGQLDIIQMIQKLWQPLPTKPKEEK